MGPIDKVHPDVEKKTLEEMLGTNPRKFIEGSIDGLLKINLEWNTDDRGNLIELLRNTDEHLRSAFDPLNVNNIPSRCSNCNQLTEPKEFNWGQTYCVVDNQPGIIRAYHIHGSTFDFFTIINGSAKFVFCDDRGGSRDLPKSNTFGNLEVVVTSKLNPLCIVVPPGIFHGWVSLEPNTILISQATNCYKNVIDRFGKADEFRIPYDTFGKDIWEVKPK